MLGDDALAGPADDDDELPAADVLAPLPGPSRAPVALVFPAGSVGGLSAVRDPFAEGARAVQAYLGARLSPRSRQNALDALRRLARLLSQNDPEQIPWPAFGFEQVTAIRTKLYELTLAGAITPGTANLTLSHWRGLIHAMYSMDLVTPAQHELTHSGAMKNVPGVRQARGRALAPREEKALREAARGLRGGYRGAMLDTAIVLAVGAGLRREEIARLTLEGVGQRTITVLGKGNKERLAGVDADMRVVANAWLDERAALALTHGGFFCSPQKPEWAMSPWSFWSLVRAAAHTAFGDQASCGQSCACLKIITGPHDFRRTFATRMLDSGMDLRQLQVLMGHASPETTAKYDKRDLEALLERRRNMKVIA